MAFSHLPRPHFRRIAARMLLACLFIRALIPPGYMPGNLLAGEFMTLCPVASAATQALLHSSQPHHHHHHHHSEEHAAGIAESCPIGSALQAEAVAELSSLPEVDLRRMVVLSDRRPAGNTFVFPRRAPARGPPLI